MRIPILILTAGALALVRPAPALDQVPPPPVLTLQEALAAGARDQPMIEAFERDAEASEQAAVAARTLPDPEVSVGIQNFPVSGHDGFSPTDDFMTMYTLGIMREQVRRSKREADADRILAEALVSRKQANAEEVHIRRAIMIAWIDAVEARAKQRLLGRMISDLRAGRKVMQAAIPTGGSTPALALETDAEIALEESQLEDAKRAEARARTELARWIGTLADRRLPDDIPDIEVPTDMLMSVDQHPEVQVALAQETVAERQVEVAREDRKPDISWSVTAGFRPSFGQMISGTVSLPLQLNRRHRQDMQIAAAQARADAARLRAEDTRRGLRRDHDAAVADYRGAQAELDQINKNAVPALESAFKAAEARYAAGGGTLDQPFAIVRRYIETAIRSVEAEGRRARAAAEILHAHGEMQ